LLGKKLIISKGNSKKIDEKRHKGPQETTFMQKVWLYSI
jgi:hypothetical protein